MKPDFYKGAFAHPTGYPHNWKQGLKRALWPHSAFGLVGLGIRAAAMFLPTPVAPVMFVGFVAWRVWAEHQDHKQGLDTPAKAIIDAASQAGWAALGAFV